jgi:hypothetical protein
LNQVTSALRFERALGDTTGATITALAFPSAWADGLDHLATVNVVNDGPAVLDVTWSGLGDPLSATLPATLSPGETTLTLHLKAASVLTVSQRLVVSSPGVTAASLELSANVAAEPTCTPSGPCVSSTFDPSLGRCVEVPLEDGTLCEPGTKCQVASACQQGRCVGAVRNCDDQDRCTVDVCYPQTGCEHVPAPPCPGDGVCQVGVCDKALGCQLAPAPDGTGCGPTQTCITAQVCITGACVERTPPEGFICEEASPCRDEGRCVATQCVHQVPQQTLTPDWQYDSATVFMTDGGVISYHDFVSEPSGAVTLNGFFNSPSMLRANTPTSVLAPEGTSRRCIIWNGHLVCADYPSDPNGSVTALDLSTGATAWSFDIHPARPDFVAMTSAIFLARLVVQSSDRLAALYESYPLTPTEPGNQCRFYFLVVLDASGHLVTSQQLSDPLLDVCDHPHPYGVASDTLGNLYIAFSPTLTSSAPLFPGTPTLLISFSKDGIFRWKRLESTLRGGELAIAHGLLYPENSAVVFDAPSGTPTVALPFELGRAVVSGSRLIPAPVPQGTSLTSFEAGQATTRWTHALPAGQAFVADQLRLASWATSQGPRTVATAFTTDGAGVMRLHAIDVQNGLTAFSCPVSLPTRTPPQLFEFANGSLTVMNGALDDQGGPGCEKCDPPFAHSSAAFQTITTPGLSISREPWVGTFGGADHDHHED